MFILLLVFVSGFVSSFLKRKIFIEDRMENKIVIPFIIVKSIIALFLFIMASIFFFGSSLYIICIVELASEENDIYKAVNLIKNK